MSRDREGAVTRTLVAVEAAGLTRRREQWSVVSVWFSVFGEASRGRESAGEIAVVAGPAAVFESRMNADKHSCGGAGKNLSRARARARARARNRARKVLFAA